MKSTRTYHSLVLRLVLFLSIILYLCSACNTPPGQKTIKKEQKKPLPEKQIRKPALVIDVVPFGNFSDTMSHIIHSKLTEIFPDVSLKSNMPYPANAWYQPRCRYKADTLIEFLAHRTPKGHVTIGLCDQDISTNNGSIPDWGIFGYSYMPGKACIASTFRLEKNNLGDQFFKIVIHELGHTAGLDHCPDPACLMRDAEGNNTTDQEKNFCNNCRKKLIKKGWMLK